MAESVTSKLKALRTRSGLSMADMARHFGFAGASSYQHYESERFTDEELPPHIVKGLLDILPGRGFPPISKEEVIMLGGMHGLTRPQLDFLDHQLWVKCIGEAADGVWVEKLEWPEDSWEPIAQPVRDVRYPGVRRRALRVRGDSMNELYPDGSYVIFVRFSDIRDQPRPGDRVVVIRRREDLSEAIVRQVSRDDRGKLWLTPRSTNPAWRALPIDDESEPKIKAEIMGLIVTSHTIE